MVPLMLLCLWLLAPATSSAATLLWNYHLPPGSPPATGTFVVQRRLPPEAPWSTITTLPLRTGDNISYTDTTLPSDQLYVARYQVLAQTAGGSSPPSESVLTTGGGAPLLAQNTLRVVSVDSEETAREDGKGSNSIDGNPATAWHTAWSIKSPPPPPHWIIVDLGTRMLVDGLTYLPRQSGPSHGTIGDYQVFVSDSPTLWGPPVAEGTWSWPAAQRTLPQIVRFAAKAGRYVQLRALKELNDNPWTSAAEMSLYAAPVDGGGTPGTIPPLTCLASQPTPQTLVLTCTPQP